MTVKVILRSKPDGQVVASLRLRRQSRQASFDLKAMMNYSYEALEKELHKPGHSSAQRCALRRVMAQRLRFERAPPPPPPPPPVPPPSIIDHLNAAIYHLQAAIGLQMPPPPTPPSPAQTEIHYSEGDIHNDVALESDLPPSLPPSPPPIRPPTPTPPPAPPPAPAEHPRVEVTSDGEHIVVDTQWLEQMIQQAVLRQAATLNVPPEVLLRGGVNLTVHVEDDDTPPAPAPTATPAPAPADTSPPASAPPSLPPSPPPSPPARRSRRLATRDLLTSSRTRSGRTFHPPPTYPSPPSHRAAPPPPITVSTDFEESEDDVIDESDDDFNGEVSLHNSEMSAIRTAGPLPDTSPLEAFMPQFNTPRSWAVFIGIAVGNGASSSHSIYHPPFTALTTAIREAREAGMIITRDTPTPQITACMNDFINIVRSHPSDSRHLGGDWFHHPQLHKMLLASVLGVMDTEAAGE
mmetsp:Transcript_4146/g.8136  ORF Transcript_4146/g.8136 Transcript_4146/m.8136 type:complete len:464 (+) Transcript_4146:109-1500(+)